MTAAASQIIYLGSKSPRRRELLKQIGVHYELLLMREVSRDAPRVGDIDESPFADEPPRTYVARVTGLKAATALAVMRSRKLPVRPILCADTTVALNNTIFGKPDNATHAREMLASLAGATHQVLTAVAVAVDGDVHQALSVSEVTFARLSDDDIKRYVESGEPLDKAGAYGIQCAAAKFITQLSGSYTGVMGLPLFETAQLLRRAGLHI